MWQRMKLAMALCVLTIRWSVILTDSQGEKIAGAGQRRTRDGLLHQGSVVTEIDAGLLGVELATRLAVRMKACSTSERFEEQVTMLAAGRYASEEWLRKDLTLPVCCAQVEILTMEAKLLLHCGIFWCFHGLRCLL